MVWFMLLHVIWWLERNRRIFHGVSIDLQKWKARVFGTVIEWSSSALDRDVMSDAVIAAWLEVL